MAGYKREVRPGVWRLEYQYEGEKYSQNVKASSPNKADKMLSLFIAEIEKGHFKKQTKLTFVEFSQLWLDKYATDNLSPTTVIDYKNRLNKYILDEFGRMNLSSIKRLHIQEFANKLVKEYNLSSKTAKNYIKLISSILNKAIEWDFIDVNVADKINIPKNSKKPKKKVVLYSYEEVEQLLSKLEELEDKELQIAIYSSFVTGARRGEIVGLSFDKFDFDRCSIDFSNNTVRVKGGTTDKEIKNGKNRLFYVPQSYIEKVKDYYEFLGCPPKETKLFTMHPDTFSSNFKSFLKDNNLREINLKDLRALNESILVNKGLDVVSVAKRIGHLPSTATNYYLDQIPEEDKKASEILENLF